MFYLIFGLLWELVSFPILIVAVVSGVSGEVTETIWIGLFAIIFNGIGFTMLGIGIHKLIRDHQTDRFGEECYGRVLDVFPNGNTINGRRQYDANVEVYVKSLNTTITVKELSGTGGSDYEVGDYVRVKYYNGDINFIEKVYPDYLPNDVRQFIANSKVNIATTKQQQPVIIYESSDVIQVDGVRYRRID